MICARLGVGKCAGGERQRLQLSAPFIAARRQKGGVQCRPRGGRRRRGVPTGDREAATALGQRVRATLPACGTAEEERGRGVPVG
jgi:hypothetical protein